MKIDNFENIEAWKEARQLVKDIYSYFSYVKDYGFKDQIQRASLSVMSNPVKYKKLECIIFTF